MNKFNLIQVLSDDIDIEYSDEKKKYKFDGIQIPMIQRDYAQGRKGEEEIRKRFLSAIFNALVEDAELELDFVYGSIKEIDKKSYFIPLDGQQRLTTLFLLHWYIGNRELVEEELLKIRSILNRFSYATRISARQFCEKLSNISISFTQPPSQELLKSGWFYGPYKKDPTVSSMLVMLDAIHEMYQNQNKPLFPSLSKLAFYILPLDGFNLTDELYIKMNARGKQLTDFENFKADLTNWLIDKRNPHHNEFNEEVLEGGRMMPFHLSFSLKVDNAWTGLFWKHSILDVVGQERIVDPYFLKFWNRYLLNKFIVTSNLGQEAIERDESFKWLYGNEELPKYENFERYKPLLESQPLIKKVQITLDQLAEHIELIQSLIKPSWSLNDSWSLVGKTITQQQRILFYAITAYLELNQFESKYFKNWIRVIWNIIVDPDIRSIAAMVSIMRLINRMARGSNDIYTYLTSDAFESFINHEKTFAKAQLEEERKKAILILRDPSWEMELIQAESHPLFMGNIGFLLLDDPDQSSFYHRKEMAFTLYSSGGSAAKFREDHILMRSLISELSKWDDLYHLNMADTSNNWQLLLRRNKSIQAVICRFCDEESIISLSESMNSYLTKRSNTIKWQGDNIGKAKLIHEQLYMEGTFHIWLQSKGAVNLKWYNNHLYVYRPGSWYDWVMLDTFRNALIDSLILRFDIPQAHQCGSSPFYWGKGVELRKEYEGFVLSFEFDDLTTLRVGVKENYNLHISNENQIDSPGWLYSVVNNYDKIRSDDDIKDLMDRIYSDVFDHQNTDSIISKVRQFLPSEIPI